MESFQSIYKAFDKLDQNQITKNDLWKIFETLQWESNELDRIIEKLRIKNSQKITFENFIQIMYELEKNFTAREAEED